MANKRDITHNMPGAWYGNDPEPGHLDGNVTVPISGLMPALAWLRRRASIVETLAAHTDAGVTIRYKLRK